MISLNSEGVRLANTENCCIAAARRPKEDALPEPLVLADPATTGPLDWKSVIDRPPSIVHLFCFRFCFRIRQHIASPSNREGRIRALGDNQALTCYWVLLPFDLSHRLGKIFSPRPCASPRIQTITSERALRTQPDLERKQPSALKTVIA